MTDQPTPENTNITKRTVQIRTLTVDTKQMTQGIFRQLAEWPVIDAAGSVHGDPWGLVNYHPDRCDDAPKHLHVVWQAGDQLHRAHVPAPEHANLRGLLASEYAMALIAEGVQASDEVGLRVSRGKGRAEIITRFNLWGVSFTGSATPRFLNAWQGSGGLYEDQIAGLRAEFSAHFGGELRPSAEIAPLLPTGPYKRSWLELNKLPQLFIGR
ncbi:hypothetical protein [Streptomyces sp. B1I3]|uniref:hypothetical protein n=1 Tax=Streptomyces sp. B1I3 TaxID=3042264 RepID=UPI002784BAC9|nr:hypothetical protein [Streptomyces sp. B1I3]MDQ0795602.1 hypothetical protein [Streptomyces sp. B1I3]